MARRKLKNIKRKNNNNKVVSVDSATYNRLVNLRNWRKIKSIRSGVIEIINSALDGTFNQRHMPRNVEYPRKPHFSSERLSRTYIPFSLHDEILIANDLGLTGCQNVQDFIKQAVEEKLQQMWKEPEHKYYDNGEISEEYMKWEDNRLLRQVWLDVDDGKGNGKTVEPYFENGEKMGYVIVSNPLNWSHLGISREIQDWEYRDIEEL